MKILQIALFVTFLGGIAGCGSGTVGLFSLSDSGSSSNSNNPTLVGSVVFFSQRTSPAVIGFQLLDAESNPADVVIFVRSTVTQKITRPTLLSGNFFLDRPGGEKEIACDGTVTGITSEERSTNSSLTGLETSPAGVTHFKLWDYEADFPGQGLRQDLELRVEILLPPGSTPTQDLPPPLPVEIGNDPPQILPLLIAPGGDIEPNTGGNIFVPLTLCDSAQDELAVKIEYIILDDPDCLGWQLTRPAQLRSPKDETPCFPVDTTPNRGVLPSCIDDTEDYFWNSSWEESTPDPGCDLSNRNARVRLRITAQEVLENEGDTALQTIFVTEPFQILNRPSPAFSPEVPATGASKHSWKVLFFSPLALPLIFPEEIRLMPITLKRAYDPWKPEDGIRILVERLWPRGIKKEDAHVDHWLRDLAPSKELRQWYSHDPNKWEEFRKRYLSELKKNPEQIKNLLALIGTEDVTFVFGSKELQKNSASVLRDYLQTMLP